MGKEERPDEGCLYLVATPVGNLEDITYRAVRVLKEADVIAAEDTRHTKKLLFHLAISKPLISFYREKEKAATERVIDLLAEGKKIALVSDAGTPGISDPGSLLVKRAVEEGFLVIPVPGASALLPALAASGLSTERFVFEGFLPRKKKELRELLKSLRNERRTIVIYESPHRLIDTLQELKESLGAGRKMVIAREITKVHEEFWRGSLGEAFSVWTSREIKGEFTLIIEGRAEKDEVTENKEKYQVLYLEILKGINQGGRLSSIVREVAAREGVSRRGLYQWFLEEIKKGE